jgi:hypothetical protein
MYCPICDQKTMNCDCTQEERRMHAEIEELNEQIPRWISVKERLPEENVEVWVVAVGPSGKALFYAAAMWRMTPSGRMEWEDEDCVIHHPTHWMPLPAPPTDSK